MITSDLKLTKDRPALPRAVAALSRNPSARNAILLLLYSGCFFLSFHLAYELRFDFVVNEHFQRQVFSFLPWIVALKLILLFAFGQFRGLLSYFSLPDLERLLLASFLSF